MASETSSLSTANVYSHLIPTTSAANNLYATRQLPILATKFAGRMQVNEKTGNAEYTSADTKKPAVLVFLIFGIFTLPLLGMGIIFLILALMFRKAVIVFADNLGMIQIYQENILLKRRTFMKQIAYTEIATMALAPTLQHFAAYDTVLILRDGAKINLGCAEILGDAQFTGETIINQINKRGGNIV